MSEMKTKFANILSILLGLVIGYFVGVKGGLSRWEFFLEIIYGIVVIYSIGDAFLKNEDKYGILTGALIGLLIAVSLDLIAGSPVVMTDKLVYVMLCSFVGWGYGWEWAYWKPVLLGSLIGGVVGVILGFNRGCNFGLVYVPTGFLNAGLTFLQLCIVGMAVTSLYLKSFGWRYLENRLQS